MRKIHRVKPAFLIIGISLIFAITSAYANYNTVMEADFLSRAVRFEAGDIADFLVDKQINLDFIPSESYVIGSLVIDLHRLLILSSLQISSISSSFSVLRC